MTGVDLSDEAVRSARDLSEESGVPATLRARRRVRLAGRRRRARAALRRRLRLLRRRLLAARISRPGPRGIAGVLGPGGRFVLVDFHPAADVFDEDWNLVRDYPAGGEPLLLDEGVGDYVAESGGGLTPAGFVGGR